MKRAIPFVVVVLVAAGLAERAIADDAPPANDPCAVPTYAAPSYARDVTAYPSTRSYGYGVDRTYGYGITTYRTPYPYDRGYYGSGYYATIARGTPEYGPPIASSSALGRTLFESGTVYSSNGVSYGTAFGENYGTLAYLSGSNTGPGSLVSTSGWSSTTARYGAGRAGGLGEYGTPAVPAAYVTNETSYPAAYRGACACGR